MNPFLEKLLGGAVRAILVWLAAKFGASLSDDEMVKLVAEITPLVVVIGWSWYQKFKEQQKLLTAQTMRAGATEREVEAAVKAGDAPTVLTPRDVAPV